MGLGLTAPGEGRAEQGEWGLFAAGGILFPSFDATDDAVAFDLVSGFGGFGVTYGLHDDLWLDTRLTLTDYQGKTTERVRVRDQDIDGTLFFSWTQVRPTVGLQYNVYPGLNVSPYIFVRGGFIFSTFRGQTFLNDEGFAFAGVEFGDSSETQWTAAVGLAFEYRFLEFLITGARADVYEDLRSGSQRLVR